MRFRFHRLVFYWVLFLGIWCGSSIRAAGLSIEYFPDSVVLTGVEPVLPGDPIISLKRSEDLETWREIGRFQGELHPYSLYFSSEAKAVFYQTIARRATALDDWSNQLILPESDLIARPDGGGLAAAPFAKFTIELADSERVYFQDSSKYPFHFSFIRERLEGYESLGFREFEEVALRKEGQKLVLGSVILAPDPSIRELAIQFAGQEAFDIADVIEWHRSTVRRLAFGEEDHRVFYMPTFEQRDVTFANEDVFAAQGIRLDTPSRWVSEPVCYSDGWALGRLRFIPTNEIEAAYGSGRLDVTDILVTDFVPSEVPLVSGILSFQPATPNSHVVLLARSSALPLAFASGAGIQAQIEAWEGQEVLLTVASDDGMCDLVVQNVEGKLSDDERAAILALKTPPPAAVQRKESANRLWLSTEGLRGEDIRFVGGKAANFGALRRALPGHSPESVAFTFDLWDRFMEQATDEGVALRDWIAAALAPFDTYPPDVTELRIVLRSIQDRIKDRTSFAPELRAGVVEALQQFSDDRKLRFRSSTNVEDSEQFSGAGLYDSFSGCLLDDLDSNSSGPSHCDLSKSKERGVFRAIRKVYASFYNENAFLERLRHGVVEDHVGMALLVHHSFPDALELANGVATLEIRKTPGGERSIEATLVTQIGAVSVANPDSKVLPELVLLRNGELELSEVSSLVPGGETVLEWGTDYRELVQLLDRAAQEFEKERGEKDRLLLDFEYKKIVPGNLVVKQIRIIPQPTPVPPPMIESILN